MPIPESAAYSAVAGFVLKASPFGERSLVVDLFTAGLGRVRAAAHLPGKKNSARRAALQPFVPLLLELAGGRGELLNLRRAEVSGRPFRLPLPGYFCACYMNELLYYLYRAREPAPLLFASCLRLLEGLAAAAPPEPLLRDFESTLLEALGCAISYRAADGQPLAPGVKYLLQPGTGFVPSGADRGFEGSILLQLARGEVRSPEAAAVLRRLNRMMLERLLEGRQLQSRKMYLEYVNRL